MELQEEVAELVQEGGEVVLGGEEEDEEQGSEDEVEDEKRYNYRDLPKKKNLLLSPYCLATKQTKERERERERLLCLYVLS